MPQITKDEKIFLQSITERLRAYRYIVRDKNGLLYLFNTRPTKDERIKEWASITRHEFTELKKEMFLFIKWEDEKPYSVAELLNFKVGK